MTDAELITKIKEIPDTTFSLNLDEGEVIEVKRGSAENESFEKRTTIRFFFELNELQRILLLENGHMYEITADNSFIDFHPDSFIDLRDFVRLHFFL